jgi:hypothetical protein
MMHSYIYIIHPNGANEGVGFGPGGVGSDETGKTITSWDIPFPGNRDKATWYPEAGNIRDDGKKSYTVSSKPYPLTEAQYGKLQDFIKNSKENTPPYAPLYGSQCATWAEKALGEAEVPGFDSPNMTPNGKFIDIGESILWNPTTQALKIRLNNMSLLQNSKTAAERLMKINGLGGRNYANSVVLQKAQYI